MMHEPYDDLDLAIAALPLDEPPAGLRAMILARTIDRAEAPAWSWEITIIGACIAVLVWAALALVTGSATPIVALIGSFTAQSITMLVNINTLAWISSGMLLAFWLTVGITPSAPQRISTRR
ncbi:MAG: hypothetical protein ACYDA1_08520 [Vulcanimicrobiaceae bacterium]